MEAADLPVQTDPSFLDTKLLMVITVFQRGTFNSYIT